MGKRADGPDPTTNVHCALRWPIADPPRSLTPAAGKPCFEASHSLPQATFHHATPGGGGNWAATLATIQVRTMHVFVYRFWYIIIQGMRLVLHILGYWSLPIIIQGMRLLLYRCCMYRPIGLILQSSDASIGLCLQSSKGCGYCCTAGVCNGLLVLAYNHPRDAFITTLLARLLVYLFRSTTIQGTHLFLHRWSMCWSIDFGLHSLSL